MMQIMKKMRDEAVKSPRQAAAAAASGPASHSVTSPSANVEMNNVAVGKQNSVGNDESRSSDAAAAAAARRVSASDRTSDPSVSEASVSCVCVYTLSIFIAI